MTVIDLALLASFDRFSSSFWKIHDKHGDLVTFEPNPAQWIMLHYAREQRRAGQPVRLRILKYRQAGCSLLWRLFVLHKVLITRGFTAISIADKLALPEQWVRQARGLVDQITKSLEISPVLKASNAHELYFDQQNSRYFIGSAEGTTPGMGETIQVVHCSEVASWNNPDEILADLLPAVPPGPNTYVIQESTGRSFGDWWWQRYYEAKRGEGGYQAVFLPWFIQAEYVRLGATWDELGPLGEREQATIAAAKDYAAGDGKIIGFESVTPGQIAWRRWMVATEFHGDDDLFANQYPATEEEAFLAGGQQVFTADQVRTARGTIREPIWRGDLFVGDDPTEYRLDRNNSGGLVIWEVPDERYHYVIGADVQWGSKDTADFDAAYVQCLESNRIVARIHSRWDMGVYAATLAALGYHYRTAILAPERNSQAASGVMAVLLGLAANGWRYPNVWVRSGDLALRSYKPEDYGFLTNEHTKAEIIALAKEETLRGGFDWCDKLCVDEMTAYIRDDAGKLTAPEGAHDDALMARMITAYVANRVRGRTDLWAEPVKIAYTFDTMEERMARHLGLDKEDLGDDE